MFRIRAWASSIVSTIKIVGLQQKSNDLIEAVIQLSRNNEQLREAVEACDVGLIKGYSDIELKRMNMIMINLR